MNILISSVGRRNYIVEYFQKALKGRGKVYTVNSIEHSAGMLASENRIVAPLINSKNYIPFLIDTCLKHNIKLVISLFDQDLLSISKSINLFKEKGIIVAISDYDVIKKTFDKYLFSQYLKSINLSTPNTYKINDEFWKNIENMKLKFPLMLKPRWGTGSIATQKVETIEELKFFFKYLSNHLSSSYISNLSDFKNEIIAQEFIIGEEFNLDIINDLKGNFKTTFIKKKLGMRAGETDSAITVEDHKLFDTGEKLGRNLKHVGILDLDILKTKQNNSFIIDANPRFGGGYPFSHNAGTNVPACLISWAENKKENLDWLLIKQNTLSTKAFKILKVG